MPNLHVTDRQVMLYMTRSQQHDQESAAAMAGFSARTARRIDKDPRLPSQTEFATRTRRSSETLLEIEVAERASRRIQRHRDQSETPVGKTFASFDFTAAPELSKPHLLALGAGGDWIKNGDNLLVFGESGTGKSHALAAICHALIDAGKRVLFTAANRAPRPLLGQRPREVRQIRSHRARRHLVCS